MSKNLLNRSLHRGRWLVSAAWLGLALGTSAYGQTLLYKWNFDNATGSGPSLAVPPAVIDTTDGYTGGNMSLFVTNGFSLSTPASSGLGGSTNAADLGLVNSAIYNSAASVLAGVVGDMSKITNFTVTLWFKLNAGVTNFGAVNGTQFNARLFCIDTNKNGTGGTAADGNELYLGLAQPSAAGQPERIQFGVFIASGQPYAEPFDGIGGGSPATFTNQWVFISAVYTQAASGTAQIYVGTTNLGAALTATMTGVGAITSVKTWLATSNLVEIGNRVSGTGNRALMGAIDDVRLYGAALTLAQLQAVQGVVSPPAITAQPVPVVAFPGQTPKLSVTATGTLPLFYNWTRNGTNLVDGGNISGSTSNILTITGLSSADAFTNYSVVITNVAGAITSSVVSVSLSSTNGAYESAVMADVPFAFYTFSETNDPEATDPDSGSYNPSASIVVAYDSTGSFNGTYGTAAENGVDGIAGPRATADGLIGFPDTNAALGTTYLDLPPTSYVSLPPFNLNNGAGTNVLTITAWINPTGPQVHAAAIVLSRSGTTTAGLDYNATNGDGNLKLGYNWNNDAVAYMWDSGLEPPPGLWSLVALVVTPTNATIYVINTNGLLYSTFVHNHASQIFEGPTLIGNDPQNANGSRTFNGSIDEVAFFGQALTASQMAALFAAASGILFTPVAPTIVSEPVWPSLVYPGQAVSAAVVTTGATSFQWQAGLSGIYTNLTDGPNISGSATASLTINSVQASNALDYIVVVTNSYGTTNSTPATLTFTPSGPPQNFTLDLGGTPIVQAAATDWNTANNWNPDGQPASISAFSNPGSSYEIVVGSRLRTPVSSNAIFPGAELVIDGDGVYEDNTVTDLGELRVKHTAFNPATNYYSHLALNGGEVFNGDTGLLVLQGWMEARNNSVLYNDVAENRSFQINSWLTGSGNIFYHDANLTLGVADFNVTGTTNTFTGQWIVDQGGLLGSGTNSLGTNSIFVGTNGLAAAVETLYDLNDINASLILGANGMVYLHQNDHFASVIINGTPLYNGTYPFSYLNGQYPVNFPAAWTQQIGSTFSTGSGQIIVVGSSGPPSSPHITGISLSGTTLSISATNGSPGGSWTLLQSTNVAVPLSQWQTNTAGNFDGSGNLSTNIANTATNLQEFYILKVQ